MEEVDKIMMKVMRRYSKEIEPSIDIANIPRGNVNKGTYHVESWAGMNHYFIKAIIKFTIEEMRKG